MPNINQVPDQALIDQAKQLHAAIEVMDCFATHDLLVYNANLNELNRRGYAIAPDITIITQGAPCTN